MRHYFDAVLHPSTGAALEGVLVRIFDENDALVDIYADENSTPIETVSGETNAAKTDADGMFSLYVGEGAYTVRFYQGDTVLKTITNVNLGIDVTRIELADTTGAALVGTSDGSTVQGKFDTLAGAGGAASVGFKRSADSAMAPGGGDLATNTILRDLREKAQEIVSVADWGVYPNNIDCAAALQKALDEAPLGCDLFFPAPKHPDYTYRVEAPLTLSRKLNLVASGARLIAHFSGAYATSDLFTVNITNDEDLDARNFRIEGFREIAFALGGRNTILITDAGANVANIGWEIANCTIGTLDTSTGYAIKVEGVGSHLNNVIRSCQISNGVYNGGADGLTIRDNNIFGTKVGVTVAAVNGAYKTRIIDNEIVARDGGVYITAGQQVDIVCNQFEQFGSYGANTSTYAGHVVLDGTAYSGGGEEVRDIRIIANNFGSGSNQACSVILVDNTIDVIIDENVFANIGTSGVDVQILSASNKWTRIGKRNRVYGIRSGIVRGAANTADPKSLLFVTDSGTGTYGYAARKVPTLAANYTGSSGFCVWKGENDKLNFEGTIAIGAGAVTAGGTVICTLDEGMRPAEAMAFGVRNTANTSLTWLNLNTDGTITCDANVNASSTIFMGAAPPMTVKGRASYLSGPY